MIKKYSLKKVVVSPHPKFFSFCDKKFGRFWRRTSWVACLVVLWVVLCCVVLSCLVMSCHVLSCLVLSCLISLLFGSVLFSSLLFDSLLLSSLLFSYLIVCLFSSLLFSSLLFFSLLFSSLLLSSLILFLFSSLRLFPSSPDPFCFLLFCCYLILSSAVCLHLFPLHFSHLLLRAVTVYCILFIYLILSIFCFVSFKWPAKSPRHRAPTPGCPPPQKSNFLVALNKGAKPWPFFVLFSSLIFSTILLSPLLCCYRVLLWLG